MDQIKHYTQVIRSKYPELRVISGRFNQDGQYNDVVILNDSLVFRFAKVPEAVKTLQIEIAVQRSLQDQLPLRIPNPTYTCLENGTQGSAFMGYPLIPGTPLWRENFYQIRNKSAKKRMAVQLAEFLRELHRVNAGETIPVHLPHRETRRDWAEMYRRIRNLLYPYMKEAARREISDHFETYLEKPEDFSFRTCLRHGDFGTGNILYDPIKLHITGVVDFGGVGLGDPAVDFAGLYISYGEDFYRDCCMVYPEMTAALRRVHFYCGTFALEEALFGIENEDEAALQAGIEQYR
jgi:aminoglycoside 2''-phosphotransferase